MNVFFYVKISGKFDFLICWNLVEEIDLVRCFRGVLKSECFWKIVLVIVGIYIKNNWNRMFLKGKLMFVEKCCLYILLRKCFNII